MAQKTFVNEVLTASDINTYLMGEGGAWTAWTPQIDQGASTNIAKTVNHANYARDGRKITATFKLTLTASGTAGSAVTVTLPVAAVSAAAIVGVGLVIDAGSRDYNATIIGTSTTQVELRSGISGTTTAGWGLTPSIALASSDVLYGQITYEAAS